MSESKTKNIYQRILAIMEDVKYVQKEEKAAKGLPYKFVGHDQVTGALHMPMVKHGVVAITSVIELKQESNRAMVKVQVSFVNVDLPEDRIEIYSYGYGIDPQDKGIGKAISYATKIAYLKCFMLETGEDVERDNINFEDISNEKLNEEQVEKVIAALGEDFESWKMIKETYGYKKVQDVLQKHFEDILIAIKLFNTKNRGVK